MEKQISEERINSMQAKAQSICILEGLMLGFLMCKFNLSLLFVMSILAFFVLSLLYYLRQIKEDKF